MRQRLSRRAMALLSCIAFACASSAISAQTNPDAKVLADFKSRVDKYMELHNRLKREAPPLKETKNPAEIQASQKALAGKLQAARKDARARSAKPRWIRSATRKPHSTAAAV